MKKRKKVRFERFFLLRTQGAIRKYPFTGGAEALGGAPDGAVG
ncbi:hypothetical protein CLV76_104266 [Marivita geojedonensis]|nr:hypothetical protein [Marivita geojedonensis]PRY80065.1 hypothetical protein CLV76_104266 [Marivita geojedonensis]